MKRFSKQRERVKDRIVNRALNVNLVLCKVICVLEFRLSQSLIYLK